MCNLLKASYKVNVFAMYYNFFFVNNKVYRIITPKPNNIISIQGSPTNGKL